MTTYQNIGNLDVYNIDPQVGTSETTIKLAFNLGNDNFGVVDTQLFNAYSVCTAQLVSITDNLLINSGVFPSFNKAAGVFIVPPIDNTKDIQIVGSGGNRAFGVSLNQKAPTFLCLKYPPSAFRIGVGSLVETATVELKLIWV
jgi:hypothetical protein